MTKTFERLHPMACSCRACSEPPKAANIAPCTTWRLDPVVKIFLARCAFWVFVGGAGLLIAGAWQ